MIESSIDYTQYFPFSKIVIVLSQKWNIVIQWILVPTKQLLYQGKCKATLFVKF